ncbi:aquaporin-3-like isoform X1 [Salvelinus fontinalis]|uniref:aquaporin-3-like isoform X1 n=1 Tax=Salvelinus fontinalis TaxID=8038 RepID=UPI0024852672|nr:aquaporin-3-like isoform X1 [Salvelinus fontinalis]
MCLALFQTSQMVAHRVEVSGEDSHTVPNVEAILEDFRVMGLVKSVEARTGEWVVWTEHVRKPTRSHTETRTMFGCGAVAQLVLSGGSHGMFLTVNFAFGFAATLGILVCGQVSGGHLNPAVTFALCLLGRDRWRKFPVYFFFQTLGAFLGSGIIFGLYYDALLNYAGELIVTGPNATAGIFATYPGKHLTLVNGFFDQTIGTAALIVCILAIVDPHNNPIPQGLEAFTVGFVVLVIGLSMGFNSGYAVNPARDLGPRLFTALAGWGTEVFTANKCWFLVPIFAPFLGAIIGVVVYQLMVGFHQEGEVRDRKSQEERVKLTNINPKDARKEEML